MKSLKLHLLMFICISGYWSALAWGAIPVLTFGQTVTGTIGSAGQTNSYTFSANKNDIIDLAIVRSGNLSPNIQLTTSNGTPIALPETNNCLNSTMEEAPVILPASPGGTYTINISDCTGIYTGTYDLYLQRLNDPGGTIVTLPYGETAAGTITSGVENNTYTFSANKNDLIDFTISRVGNLAPRIRLYNSAGTELGSATNPSCLSSEVEWNAVKMPANDTYTLLVGDCSNTWTGTYTLYTQRTNNPSETIPVLWHQVQTGSITEAAQSDTYTFEGIANDTVDFTLVRSGNLSPKIRIFNPDGTPFQSANIPSGGCHNTVTQLSNIQIPASGTYTILIGDCTDLWTGNYTLNTQCIPASASGCPMPVPTLISISSTSILVGSSGFTLTVNGTNFVNVDANSVVVWNGNQLTTTWVSINQLTVTVPASDIALAGVYPVTVYTPTPGGGTSNAVNFVVFNPKPVLTTVSPTSITAGGVGFTLTVTGSGFVPGSSVQWNGMKLATTYVSATQLTALVPANDYATASSITGIPITVYNPTEGTPAQGGGASGAKNIIIDNPVPIATSLSPVSAVVGSALTNLIVNGSNFVSGSTVNWNGSPHLTTFVSANQLSILLSASDTATLGTVPVTVTNPVPGGGTSSPALSFTIVYPVPTTVSPLIPASGTAGGPAFTLTVNGTGFYKNASQVNWNGSPRVTTYVSATQLTAAILASDIVTAGTASIAVSNPTTNSLGGGTSSPALIFKIIPPVPPTISTLSSTSAVAGRPGFTLTVTGTNFENGSTVQWGSTALSTTYVSGTKLTAAVPTLDLAMGGVFEITVLNSVGRSNQVPFTVYNPLPVLSSLSSSSAVVGGPAFTLTLTGAGFVSTSVVNWNGNACKTSPCLTTYVSATKLTVTIPAADLTSTGIFPVTVTNPTVNSLGGGTSAAITFTVVYPLPTTTSPLSPASGTAGEPAFTLTVNGTNFFHASQVNWNGSFRVTTYVSPTQLKAAILASDIATAGSALVTVTNPKTNSLGGGASTPALTFTINNPMPTATSLMPANAWAGSPAFTLTVTGTNFVNGSVVIWNKINLATTYVSATQLTAAVSAADIAKVGTASVTVFNPAPPTGGQTSKTALTFTIVPQVLPVFSPTGGTYGAGQWVTITDAAAGATIYYTTDNTTPITSATTLTYTGPILVEATETIKAVAAGTSYSPGSVVSQRYTLIGSPTVLNIPPTAITATGATLTATANDLNVAGQVWWVYGKSTTALTSSTPPTALPAKSGTQTVTAPLTGLTPKTTYYVELVVSTQGGAAGGGSTTYGAILSFTTAAAAN